MDDDVEVISFAPSEHLRNKILLEYLWHLKLSVWSMICDMLHNTKSLRHVGNQLMEGKLFIIDYIRMYIRIVNSSINL